MEKPLRFGVIGAGGVGALHLAALRRLEAIGRVEVVAIADPSEGCRGKSLQEGLISPLTPWYPNYLELLDGDHGLDVVSISTPIPYHYEMTLEALSRGLYVHLEKPPVPLIQQLDHLIAEDGDKKVSVGFQFINSRCLRAMKDMIVDGVLGRVHSIRAICCWPRLDSYYSRAAWAGRMSLDGRAVFDGPVTNALAHLVHNIMHLASPEVDGYALPEWVVGELYRARSIESYDCACVRGVFSGGIEFTMAASHASRVNCPFQLRVEGTHGWALLSADGERLETSAGMVMYEPETTEKLIQKCYERLVSRVSNEANRVATQIRDTVPYVRTTNGMFLSSGGIHDIEGAYIERFEGEGGFGYHIDGIMEAMDGVMETGRLFSESGLPWATAHPRVVRLDSFDSVSLKPDAEVAKNDALLLAGGKSC